MEVLMYIGAGFYGSAFTLMLLGAIASRQSGTKMPLKVSGVLALVIAAFGLVLQLLGSK